MNENMIIKIFSMSFKNRYESLHLLTIPKKAYLFIATDMELTFSLKTSNFSFKIQLQTFLIYILINTLLQL